MLLLLLKLVPFFLLMTIGYIATWRKILSERDSDSLIRYVYYIAVPSLLFYTIVERNMNVLDLSWRTILGYFVPTSLGYIVCLIFWQSWRRLKPQNDATTDTSALTHAPRISIPDTCIFAFACVFSNLVLIGIPTTQAVFGNEGITTLVTIVSFHSLALITMLIMTLEWSIRDRNKSPAKVILGTFGRLIANPLIFALTSGLIWSTWINLEIPHPIATVLKLLKDSVTAVSLLALGAALFHFGFRIKSTSQISVIVFISVIKLVIMPLLVFIMTAYILHLAPITVMVSTFIAGLPSGTNAYIFSSIYNTDRAMPSGAIFVSSVLSVVTLPILLSLLYVFSSS